MWKKIMLEHKRSEEKELLLAIRSIVFYYLLLSSFKDYFGDNSLKGTRMVELERKVRKAEFKLLYICRTRHKNVYT
jgi:hypothetical protein